MISYASFSFFLLYFGITFVIYSIIPKKVRWVVLLLGSLTFYFISSKGNIAILLTANFIVWLTGLVLGKLSQIQSIKRKGASKKERKTIKTRYRRKKCIVLAFGVMSVTAMLFVGKYTNFFIETFNSLFSQNVAALDIVQPLGLSFFTLQAISYMADVYYGRIQAEKNPLRVTLYLSFMLTVVEGPIARYGELGVQLKNPRYNTLEDISTGFLRVLWGLFKKIVIADRAVLLADVVFDNHEKYSGIAVIIGIAFYTLQLYCEFSGIMDVVCGLGKMLGLNMPENFKRPFFAKSINEFWQRWHITLGVWLRDYIFYPISLSNGMKKLSTKARKSFSPYYAAIIPTTIALFFVWFSNGFWHGAGWKYIVYGLYYFVLMTLGMLFEPLFAKITKFLHINRSSGGYEMYQIVRTIIIVNFGMLIFRADNLNVAFDMFVSIFKDFNLLSFLNGGHSFNLSIGDYIMVAFGFAALTTVGFVREKGIDITAKVYKLPYITKMTLYLAVLFLIIIFGAYGEEYGVVDLIYANF